MQLTEELKRIGGRTEQLRVTSRLFVSFSGWFGTIPLLSPRFPTSDKTPAFICEVSEVAAEHEADSLQRLQG